MQLNIKHWKSLKYYFKKVAYYLKVELKKKIFKFLVLNKSQVFINSIYGM